MKYSAVIVAAGVGQRMKLGFNKAYAKLSTGKTIIETTVEVFLQDPDCKQIVLVTDMEDPYSKQLSAQYGRLVVARGGATRQESVYSGLKGTLCDYVLIHDGVRPLIDGGIISKNIEAAKKYGAAITVKPVIETVIQVDEADVINQVIERSTCQTAVAPQTFALSKIHSLHLKAQAENQFDMTDSATLARYFGLPLHTVMGGSENIKITTPSDFYIFRAIYEARENAQIFG